MNETCVLTMGVIYANPEQPRKEFDQDKLEELAMSIKQYGVLEPIVVTPREDRFMIIAGERRFRASGIAQLQEIPARIIEADDALVEELALLENIQRQDLNILEEARAFQALLGRGWSKEELAQKMGFKQVWRIDERTSLLNLTEEIQDYITKGKLTNSQAFEISRLSADRQPVAVNKVLRGELKTYNAIRSFVTGMIEIENQGGFFELQEISESERTAISAFDTMLKSVERFIGECYEQEKSGAEHLKKAGFRQDISSDRIDVVIQHLQKVRKTILAGQGMKDALVEVAA